MWYAPSNFEMNIIRWGVDNRIITYSPPIHPSRNYPTSVHHPEPPPQFEQQSCTCANKFKTVQIKGEENKATHNPHLHVQVAHILPAPYAPLPHHHNVLIKFFHDHTQHRGIMRKDLTREPQQPPLRDSHHTSPPTPSWQPTITTHVHTHL